jgi:hypothetical protein
MTPIQFIIQNWNEGKDAAWIADRIQHRYPNALEALVAGLIKVYQGSEALPGFPLMRKEEGKI